MVDRLERADRRARRALRSADGVRRPGRQRGVGVARPRPHGRAPGRAALAAGGRRAVARRAVPQPAVGPAVDDGPVAGRRGRLDVADVRATSATPPTGRLHSHDGHHHAHRHRCDVRPDPVRRPGRRGHGRRRPVDPGRGRCRRRPGRREGRRPAPARPRPGVADGVGVRGQGRPDARRPAPGRRRSSWRSASATPPTLDAARSCATSAAAFARAAAKHGAAGDDARRRRRRARRRRRPGRRRGRSCSPATATAR